MICGHAQDINYQLQYNSWEHLAFNDQLSFDAKHSGHIVISANFTPSNYEIRIHPVLDYPGGFYIITRLSHSLRIKQGPAAINFIADACPQLAPLLSNELSKESGSLFIVRNWMDNVATNPYKSCLLWNCWSLRAPQFY
jgi:hypothetical protein